MDSPNDRIAENKRAQAETHQRADEQAHLLVGLSASEDEVPHGRYLPRPTVCGGNNYRCINTQNAWALCTFASRGGVVAGVAYPRSVTIFCNNAASASGAVTCAEWLASIS